MNIKTLPPQASVNPADFTRTYRHVEVDVETSLEDVLRPGFWAHHATKFNVHDIVDVVASDGNLDVQLRVTRIGVGYVEMRARLIHAEMRTATAAPVEQEVAECPEGYIVNHAPKTGWRVWTKNPPLEVSRNHKSKHDAITAAIVHAAKAQGLAA